MLLPPHPSRHYRYHGYDYRRGASLFLTFALKTRRPLLGRVEGEAVVHSAAGQAVAATIAREAKRPGGPVLHGFVVMPDHVHARVYVRPGAPEPLRQVGQFVANVKRWSAYHAARLGIELVWQESFHDRLCLSREIIERVEKYIANNPLKWSLMHGDKALMRVEEPLEAACLPLDEWWSGVGNKALLGGRMMALRLSRKIPSGEIAAVVARCIAEVQKGFVPISTFISPAERALAEALLRTDAPMIRVVPDALERVYRPKGDEPRLFAQGQLLLLSRPSLAVRRLAAWQGLNEAIAGMAQVARYVTGLKSL